MNSFIVLLKIALTGEYQSITQIDWNMVFSLAQAHNVNNLICEAIQYLPKEQQPDSDIYARFQKSMNYAVAMEMNQKYNVAEVMASFEENQISVIMLKGWVMKQLYPRSDLRSMSDTAYLCIRMMKRKYMEFFLGMIISAFPTETKKKINII